jgi:hypothetical protein
MNQYQSISPRQPVRAPWSLDRLIRERSIALGLAIDDSTWKTYGSALNSYLSFVHAHNFDTDPTPETLSFFIVYMSNHISPRSVSSYLSGICQQLEPYFPDVRKSRSSTLVRRTLRGCLRLSSHPISRKRALTLSDLRLVSDHYKSSRSHDDLLFLAMLNTGFFALLRLGELTFPDDPDLQNWRKITKRTSVSVQPELYSFLLPAHKADKFFEGNKIIVTKKDSQHDPLNLFVSYLHSRDHFFPLASPLWLTRAGTVPTRSFFISKLRNFFPDSVSGQSMRAGGATLLAETGTPPSLIQATGRWASDAFMVYIRKNPTLIQALLYAHNRTLS